jgi:mRNA interferase RelE/StbE
MYELIFSKEVARFIESLDKGYKRKIKEILEALRGNPFSYPYKKIRGEQNLYRIRVGKYRILYEVEIKKDRIVIVRMDKRGRVYER